MTQLRQRTEDQLLDKLIHELEMNDRVTEDHEAAAVDLGRSLNCFTCGLIQWVRDNGYDFAFGPELCLADELARQHEHSPKHHAEYLERVIDRRQRTHRERMFRLHEEIRFVEADIVAKQALIERQRVELQRYL